MIESSEITGLSLEELFSHMLLAPFEYNEIVPQILPLVAGLLVMEFYFGKHKREGLGWNTAVGNATVWAVSGGALIYTNSNMPATEMWLSLMLIGAGVFILYMDFYHLWPKEVAWRISSSITIYLIAYVIVVLVETSIPVNEETLYGSAIFIAGMLTILKFAQMLMTPTRSNRI